CSPSMKKKHPMIIKSRIRFERYPEIREPIRTSKKLKERHGLVKSNKPRIPNRAIRYDPKQIAAGPAHPNRKMPRLCEKNESPKSRLLSGGKKLNREKNA